MLKRMSSWSSCCTSILITSFCSTTNFHFFFCWNRFTERSIMNMCIIIFGETHIMSLGDHTKTSLYLLSRVSIFGVTVDPTFSFYLGLVESIASSWTSFDSIFLHSDISPCLLISILGISFLLSFLHPLGLQFACIHEKVFSPLGLWLLHVLSRILSWGGRESKQPSLGSISLFLIWYYTGNMCWWHRSQLW